MLCFSSTGGSQDKLIREWSGEHKLSWQLLLMQKCIVNIGILLLSVEENTIVTPFTMLDLQF